MIEHLSYSSINKYLNCPAAWKFQYIDKLPTKPNANLVFGKAFHETIETFISAKSIQMKIDLIETWTKKWNSQLEKESGIDWEFEGPENYHNEGIRMLQSQEIIETINQIKPKTNGDSLAIEQKISLNVPGVPIPLIGFIDIIEADGVPADIKTSARTWNLGQAEDELQPLFYLAAMNQAGIQTPGYKFRHYIFTKTKIPKSQVITSSHNINKIMFLFQMIKNVWLAIEKDVFNENPTTWLCNQRYCDFWDVCRGKYD